MRTRTAAELGAMAGRAFGLLALLMVLCVGAVLLRGLTADTQPPGDVRDYYLAHGVGETGAINLVSAIYLGYRAFDTLGETIVLLLAVTAVLYFVEDRKPDP